MDYSLENHKSFIGKPISDLPTPALVVNLPVLKQNIDTLHQDVERLGIGFRPHVKTLKVRYKHNARVTSAYHLIDARSNEDDAC